MRGTKAECCSKKWETSCWKAINW